MGCSLNWGVARRLICQFRSLHPEVELVVEDGDEIALADGLNAGRLNVVIAPDAARRRGWRSVVLGSERLFVVLPESHRLCASNEVQPNELKGERLLFSGHASGDLAFRKVIAELLDGQSDGFRHYPVQRDTLIDLVALGFGTTICPGGVFGAFYPKVVLRPINSDLARLTYCLFWPESHHHPAIPILQDLANAAFISQAMTATSQ